MSFFNEFNNIVPYFVKVNIGKNRPFKNDPTQRSLENHKGKMIEVYKKATTLEELKKYGYGEYPTYIPAQQISMPINIQITSDEKVTPFFEETSKYTNKKTTSHTIRIFDKNQVQIGCVFLTLSPSGDIESKTSFYNSPDRSESLSHQVAQKIKDGRFIKDDVFDFIKNSSKGTRKVHITQRDGKVVGASIIEQDLETRKDVAFQSITLIARDETTPKLRTYLSSCVTDETDIKRRGGTLIPWECSTLENDLLQYPRTANEFNSHIEWVKELSGIEITPEKAIEIGRMPYSERRKAGIPPQFNESYYCNLAKYLLDESNDLLKGFRGNYIGNILRLTDNGYEACVVTTHQKGGQNYKLYTLIDLTGTSLTQGTGLDEFEGISRDEKYLERLKNSDKTPTFVTTVGENGNEELILFKGNAVSGDCPEYVEFMQNFITPFSEIKPIQISQILNKQNKKDAR